MPAVSSLFPVLYRGNAKQTGKYNLPAPYPPFAVRWRCEAFMMPCTSPACLCREPPLCGLFLVTRELVALSAGERHGMSLAPYAKATEEESTMALVHTQLAWGYIVGVMVLGCLAGCSLKDTAVPLPAGPHAPAGDCSCICPPGPCSPDATRCSRRPTRDCPDRHSLLVWAGFPWPGNRQWRDVQSTCPDRCPSDAAVGDRGRRDQSGNGPIRPGED